MIQIKEPQVKNIVNVTVQDKLTRAAIDAIVLKIDQTLARYDKVRLYMEIPDFEGYTLQGFFEDVKETGKHLSDFEKVAVVTDEGWIARLGSLSDLVVGAEVKPFGFKEVEAARAWIAA